LRARRKGKRPGDQQAEQQPGESRAHSSVIA
jgi:hypothetical protein